MPGVRAERIISNDSAHRTAYIEAANHRVRHCKCPIDDSLARIARRGIAMFLQINGKRSNAIPASLRFRLIGRVEVARVRGAVSADLHDDRFVGRTRKMVLSCGLRIYAARRQGL